MAAAGSGAPYRSISVTAPLDTAMLWTRQVLFRPFDIGKWFGIGFCAWLAWLGQTGGNFVNLFGNHDSGASSVDWIRDHLAVVIVIGTIAFVFLLALGVLVTWLSSRAQFLFVDNVLRNRSEIGEPWQRFAAQGNSLFVFRLIVALIFVGIWLALAIPLGIALYSMTNGWEQFPVGAILLVCGTALLVVPLALAGIVVTVGINDFVVPVQWLRGCTAMEGWREFLRIANANPGALVLYVLMKIVIMLAITMIACVATCVTCCIAMLPYIGTVILLPLYVFHRTYTLHFVSQLGPEFHPLCPGGAPWIPASPASASGPPAGNFPPPPPLTPPAGEGDPS